MHNLRHLNSSDLIYTDSVEDNALTNNSTDLSLISKNNVLSIQQINLKKNKDQISEHKLQQIISNINSKLSHLSNEGFSEENDASSKNHNANIENLRLLVVEDDLASQKVIYLMLRDLGYKNIDLVGTGQRAIEAFTRHKYDLIILDIGLPDIDGLDTSKEIRKSSKNDKTAVIALTAFSREEIEEKCYASGINDVIIKPVFINELRNVLESWTNLK